MNEMQSLFVSAAGLAITFSALPGAITAEALRRGATDGVRPVLLLRLGALIGSVAWAATALLGVGVLAQHRPVGLVLGAAGGLLLLRMAWGSFASAVKERAPTTAPATAPGDLLAGTVIALVSPKQAAFWLGVGGGLATGSGQAAGAAGGAVFLGGFVGGHLLFTLGFVALIGWGKSLFSRPVCRWINLLSSAALVYFGVGLLLDVARPR